MCGDESEDTVGNARKLRYMIRTLFEAKLILEYELCSNADKHA
jgi:hypothetical protein